jgi:hypothetical protein
MKIARSRRQACTEKRTGDRFGYDNVDIKAASTVELKARTEVAA